MSSTQPNPPKKLTFIELFAGVGAFRLALEKAGLTCTFASEINPHAQRTYAENFGSEDLHGDILCPKVQAKIPESFDVLVGGFPCQTFSILGLRQGFDDPRGRLFFDVMRIAEKHRPKVLFLENVKNLLTHAKGKTFEIMREEMIKIGYTPYYQILGGASHGNIAQGRERLFIVAFRDDLKIEDFGFPAKIPLTQKIADCLESTKVDPKFYYTPTRPHFTSMDTGITSTDTLYQWRRSYMRENKKKLCPTLVASMGKGGNNVPILRDADGIRKLTPRECFNFQGFPQSFRFPTDMADTHLYAQAGNSIIVQVIERILEKILEKI